MNAQKRVKLLKDEFNKYTKGNTIVEEGFVKIGQDLGIDIYSDVSVIVIITLIDFHHFLLL